MSEVGMRMRQARIGEFIEEELWVGQEILPFGADIKSKLEGILRIAFQNINGISYNSDKTADEEIDAMDMFGIDILGLAETNISWTMEQRLQLATAIQLKFSGGRSITSAMKSKTTGYLPGGTATICQGPVSGRVYRRGSDPLGRFTWMALRGQDGTGVILVTGYRVSQKKGAMVGTNTAFVREWEALREMGESSPDPRNHFLRDVSELLHEWGNRGFHPIVLMDANDTPADDEHLDSFMKQHGLIDLIDATNDGEAPRTYRRGPRRLDYCLGDEKILSAVTRAGSLGEHDGVSYSDHTMQFIDLDNKKLFGSNRDTPYATYEREFKLKDTKKKAKFIKELTRIYEHQRIPERVQKLAELLEKKGPIETLVQKYQKIDDDITRAMRAAAKASGRKDYGYQRSDVLVTAGRKVRLMKSIASCIRTRMTQYSTKVQDLAEELEFELPIYSTLTRANTRRLVTEAICEKKEIQKMAAEHRAKWLERLAQEVAEQSPNSDWEKALKQMITVARQRATNKRLSSIFKPEWSNLDYIEVPNESWFLTEDGEELYEFDNGILVAHPMIEERVFEKFGVCKVLPENTKVVNISIEEHGIYVNEPSTNNAAGPTWKTVDNPAEVQAWLRKRNKRHLMQMQVEKRPPTTKAFQHILAEHGTSDVADAILNGEYNPEELEMGSAMENFIKALKKSDEEKKLTTPQRMTTKDFQESMKVTDEDTSSSPAGLHYTLWKAISEDDELSETHATMLSLPFMYGFKCERWLKVIDCMLEKKHGIRKIHIMRIICLFEADFNTALKWYFAKHIMPNAELTDLSPDQWGGRNNRSAPACAMRKLITWEYARFTKSVLASFLADLQSNFDCILPDMSTFLVRKKGMSKEAAYTRAATMANLKRSVRTATGTSEETYQHDPGNPPLPGEGQGKADSMAVWTLISSEILKVHSQMCHGIKMIDVTGETESDRLDDGYVDDTDTYAGAPETNEVEEAVYNLENNAQTWNDLVGATGGLLAFHKCLWQTLAWIAVAGEYLMQSNRNVEGDIWLRDQWGRRHKIKRKPFTEPNPGLGFLLCPDANQKFEYDKRLKQAQDIAKKVATCTLNAKDAWLGLMTRTITKITYPFGLTRFTKKQLSKIAVVIDNPFFSKLNISRKMPKIIMYAPPEFGGISFPSIETIQDQKGITLFLRQLQWDKEVATDLRILISHAQLDSGLTDPIMEDTKTWLPHLEIGQIAHLRERLHELQGSIPIEDIWHPKLQRVHDKSIMKELSRLPGVKKGQLKKANLYRKWLKVITIADLASNDGKCIPANRFDGRWRANSNLKWHRQPPPTKKIRETFRQLVKRAFCSRHKHYSAKTAVPLDRQLGDWLQVTRHVLHKAYRTSSKLYVQNGDRIDRYTEHEQGNYFVEDGHCLKVPLASHPAEITIDSRGRMQTPTHYQSLPYQPPEEENADEVDQRDPEHIYNATSILAVSDASVDQITGDAAFNWRITTYDKLGLITKSSFADGNPLYMNSYRGEMAGIRDLVEWMHNTELKHKIVKIVCDNKSCVDNLNNGHMTLTQLDKPEADLIQDVKRMLQDFTDVTIEWVQGHQDDSISYDDLPLEAQLNVDCDHAAKQHMKEGTKPTGPPKPIKGMKATLYLGGNIVTTKMNEQIQLASQTTKMMAYVADKFDWTDDQTKTTVNWRAIGRAKRRLDLYRSIRTSKMMYGWLNTGRQKKKLGGDQLCPCCGNEEEDQHHLYLCKNAEMQSTLKASISTLTTKLVKDGLTSPVYTAFINAINRSTEQDLLQNDDYEDERTTACTEAQTTLGQEAILRGFHHIDWLQLLRDTWVPPTQSPDGKTKERRKDPLEQATALIRGVWDIFEAQWKCRNSILHCHENALIERSKDSINSKLIDFKRNNFVKLRRCDRFLIDNHSIEDVIKWPLERKKATLDLLERLSKIYKGELKQETASYRDIANYFIRIPRTTTPQEASGTAPSDGSSTHESSTMIPTDIEDTLAPSSSSENSEIPPLRSAERPRRAPQLDWLNATSDEISLETTPTALSPENNA